MVQTKKQPQSRVDLKLWTPSKELYAAALSTIPLDPTSFYLLMQGLLPNPGSKLDIRRGAGFIVTSADGVQPITDLSDFLSKGKTVETLEVRCEMRDPQAFPELRASLLANTLNRYNIKHFNGTFSEPFNGDLKLTERGLEFTVVIRDTYLGDKDALKDIKNIQKWANDLRRKYQK